MAEMVNSMLCNSLNQHPKSKFRMVPRQYQHEQWPNALLFWANLGLYTVYIYIHMLYSRQKNSDCHNHHSSWTGKSVLNIRWWLYESSVTILQPDIENSDNGMMYVFLIVSLFCFALNQPSEFSSNPCVCVWIPIFTHFLFKSCFPG